MNADKTQLVRLGTRQQLAKMTTTELPLLSVLVKPSSAAAVLDRPRRQHRQPAADHRRPRRTTPCVFQLRQLRIVR